MRTDDPTPPHDRTEPTDEVVPLLDLERLARLRAIVDPVLHPATRGVSLADLTRMCAYGLMENHEWAKAGRAIILSERLKREEERAEASGRPVTRLPLPPAARRPAPSPAPKPAPPPKPDIASERERWIRMKELYRLRRANRSEPL